MPSDLDTGTTHGQGRPGSVIRRNPKTGQRHLDDLVWGLLPHDTEDPNTAPRPINARAETVATHPMFASAFRDRRAIVAMSVYYQRQTIGGSKQVFAISRRDGEPMGIAGLWEAFRWPDGRSPGPIASSPPRRICSSRQSTTECRSWWKWRTGPCGSEKSPAILRCCCGLPRQTSCSLARPANARQQRRWR
jgi:SOS response associated peptidase (SRAP)